MIEQGEAHRATARGVERQKIRVLILRAYVRELERLGLAVQVQSALCPATRTTLAYAPVSTWVAGTVLQEIDVVVAALTDDDGLRTIASEVARNAMLTFFRPLAEHFFQLSGVTPAALFTRANALTRLVARGIDFSFEPTGPRGGMLIMRVPGESYVPRAMFVAASGTLATTFDLCGVTTGSVSLPELLTSGPGCAARFAIAW